MSQLPVIQPGRPLPASGAPPIFEKIGIVGLGLIGGSIALAARQLWPKALVIGVDNKDVLETAMRLHAIDVAADDLIVLAEADIVILAAPVKTNIAAARGIGRQRPPAGGRHRYRQHQARRRRGRGRSTGALHVHRRSSAGRRGAGRPRARAPGSVQRAALGAHPCGTASRPSRRRTRPPPNHMATPSTSSPTSSARSVRSRG